MLLPIASAHGQDLGSDAFRLLVEALQDYAIFMLDADGRVLTWNRGAERIKGYSADEIVGRHFSIFYPPDDVAAGTPAQVLRTALRDGRVEYEGWRVRKDGTRFWANVVITALYDETGRLRGFGKITRDLTERRAVAEELRRSEERFRLLIEGIRDYAVYMLDPSGRVSTWNPGAEKIKGYRAAEIVGRHYSTFFRPEDVEAGRPEAELTIARTVGRFEEEAWRVRKDGTHFWANVVLTPLRDAGGELVGFAKVTRDLTARKHAEETARELVRERAARAAAEEAEDRIRIERERYRELSKRLEVILESIGDGIIVQDRTTNVIFANSAVAEMCGLASVQELVGQRFADVLEHFDFLDEKGQPFERSNLPARRVLRGDDSSSTRVLVRDRRSGREWWALIRATPVVSDTGEPELAVSIWHDATAERRRQEHERFLARATTALSSGTLHYEETLRSVVEVVMPALADFAFFDIVEGADVRRVAAAHDDPEVDALIKQTKWSRSARQDVNVCALSSGSSGFHPAIDDVWRQDVAAGPEHLELLRRLQLGSMVTVPMMERGQLLGALTLCFGKSGRHHSVEDLQLAEELARRASVVVVQSRLFAEAQNAARAAAEAARDAEEASRVKDEFLATVSHELRTPLNAILGWATLLRDRSEEPSLVRGLEVIQRNAQAQGKIIEDILDVSRIITGKLRLDPKNADLVAVVHDAVEVVRPSAAAKRITLDFGLPGEPCFLVADPERLQQVVWNILSNAVKFTDPGGRIAIVIDPEPSQLRLTVTDTGRGIDPAFVPYVFDRFKQADASSTRRVGGLGLGLAIVRHIVELHGGQVEAASEGIGKGSTFSITLPVRPVVPAVQGAERPMSRKAEHPTGELTESLLGLRVLVVDDETDARELLKILLEGAGAVVEIAGSASEAFDLVQRFRPEVLVSDIAMPDEDGYGLMRRVRALDPALGGGIPSLALTAYARGEDKTRAIGAGFTTHIGKPVRPQDLLSAVANLARFSPKA